jgi:acetoin utilization deacetylase AcuC-like enzyme
VHLIEDALRADSAFELVQPTAHGLDPVVAVHDPDMVRFLADVWERYQKFMPREHVITETVMHPELRRGMGAGTVPDHPDAELGRYSFETMSPIVKGTFAAATGAVDVALSALDHVLAGETSAYALCRPPGHHAAYSLFGGFCYLNNAAIVAQNAIDRGAARVTVLDVDYHHGNGTQQIFYERPDVQYVSLHGDPVRAWPYYTGYSEEQGSGKGSSTNLNLPLPEHCDDARFLVALDQAIEAIASHAPELLVVSLGVDTYLEDPLGDFDLSVDVQRQCGQRIAALATPMVVVQEGGYATSALGTLVTAFLHGISADAQP